MDHAPANVAARAARSIALAPKSVLVGLVGRGIGASRTPAMHEAAARSLQIPYAYRLIDGDRMDVDADLASILRFVRHFGFDGLNVTFPWKQEIVPLLDALSPEAAAVGSVNTVTIRDGRLTGYNTDCSGFRMSFEAGLADAPREDVLLLGAGGAGAAVAQALLDAGAARILIYDADASRSQGLAARLLERNGQACAAAVSDPQSAAARADGIVNATPVGMAKMPGIPIPAEAIVKRHWVADIVYFPLETELLKVARAKGCCTLSGEGMATFQAVAAFEHFTGRRPDPAVMTAAFAAFDREHPVRDAAGEAAE